MLKEKVEELQLSLQQEVEQHQRELTALQTVHSERTQALVQSHERQIAQLQERVRGMYARREGGGRERRRERKREGKEEIERGEGRQRERERERAYTPIAINS